MTAALAGTACMASGTFLTRRWTPAIGCRYVVDTATLTAWVTVAQQTHTSHPHLQRAQAMRSASSLAAMTMVLAAQGMGRSSGAMSRFDPEGAARVFALAANELPVILATVGHSAPANWPQEPRKPMHEVMASA